jgi:hypothetical protein
MSDPRLDDRNVAREFRRRISHSLLVVVLACVVGAVAARKWGVGLKPHPVKPVKYLARMETIRLPVGARNYSNLKSMVVKLIRVDDYARVYLNNHLGLQAEYHNDMFYGPPALDKTASKRRSDALRYVVQRENPVGKEHDIAEHIKPGRNYLLIELDNSAWGACDLRVDIVVNGHNLEGFPRSIAAQASTSVLFNPKLSDKIAKAAPKKPQSRLEEVSSLDEASCLRHVFMFEVQK